MIKKYFTEKQIYAATFFGGPIPAGILIYRNFKRIEEDRKAAITLILTFIFTVLLFYGLMQLPDSVTDKLPNILFTSLYTVIVYFVYHTYLAKKINERIVENENIISNWNVAGLTLLGFVINMVIIFAIAFSEPAFPGEKMVFGNLNHEIFYDQENVNEAIVENTGKILTDVGFFQDDYLMAVKLEKNSKILQLIIPIQNEFWNDSQILSEFYMIKNELKHGLNQDIEIVLIHYSLDGKTLTKNI